MWPRYRSDGREQSVTGSSRKHANFSRNRGHRKHWHRCRDRGIDFDLAEFNHGNAVRHAAVHGFGYGSVQHGSFLGGEWCGGRQYRDRNHYRERPVYGEHARNVHGDGNFDL
jgi:hypothetical protein